MNSFTFSIGLAIFIVAAVAVAWICVWHQKHEPRILPEIIVVSQLDRA